MTDDTITAPASTQEAIEYCYGHGWTDGLPVVSCTAELLDRFLAQTDRPADDVLLDMPHLKRSCTVRLAAINAAMAGCRPEYFPVVLAAWDSLRAESYTERGIWQSTTGTAPLPLVNGPVQAGIGLNSEGNVFGPGVRARFSGKRHDRPGDPAVGAELLGLEPRVLDQATQGTPAKHTCCTAENEEGARGSPCTGSTGSAPRTAPSPR